MGFYSMRRALLSGDNERILRAFRQEQDPQRSAKVAVRHMTQDEQRSALDNLRAFNAWRAASRPEELRAVERYLGFK